MTTNAGRALLAREVFGFSANHPVGYYEADLSDAIAAIEAEKEAEVRARLAEEVEALHSLTGWVSWDDGLRPNAEQYVPLAAVLALIQPEGAKA